VAAAAAPLHELALGGTAVGTGLNAPAGYADAAVALLARRTGLPLRRATNPFAAQGAHDAVVAFSGSLRDLAVGLAKIAGDVRLIASGPRCGLGELRLPAVEPGSSIMPGKTNPGQAEALAMACARVCGLDVAVAIGGLGGQLQMNAAKPLLAISVLEQVDLLATGAAGFVAGCIDGLEPEPARLAAHVADSLMTVTALVPRLGYDAAAAAARRALATGAGLRDVVVGGGLLDAAEFDRLVDPRRLAEGSEPPDRMRP
ncbi:MAG: lyase family protein, partial [Candidatus Krumholzibacteriia bacterium]